MSKLIEIIKKVIKEEIEGGAPRKAKIQYIPITKRAYTTQSTGIEFNVIINGSQASGFWLPSRGRYVSEGVDINELKTKDGRYINIFSGGGTHKTYEISANLEEAPKQPKDLRFTGPTLSIDNLKPTFISKVKKALENPDAEPKLSDQFLQYFGYK